MYSEYEGRCGSCRNYSFAGKYQKGYCSRYRAYYYPDDSCQYYEENSYSSGGCWLTSACCEAKGLSDDCDELIRLRLFRDDVLAKMPDGEEKIKFYYIHGPRIVKQINASPQKKEIYDKIFNKIHNIIDIIEQGKYDLAVAEYLYMMYRVDLASQKEGEI